MIKIETRRQSADAMERGPRHPEVQDAMDRLQVGQSFIDPDSLHKSTIYLYAERAGIKVKRTKEYGQFRITRTA